MTQQCICKRHNMSEAKCMGYCRIGIKTFCIKEMSMEATYLTILQAVQKTLLLLSKVALL